MGYCCEACGSKEYSAVKYRNAVDDDSVRRCAIDAIQRIGWSLLPIHLLPATLSKRFAQGLFKFKTVRICASCGLGVLHPMPSLADLNRFYTYFFDADVKRAALPPLHPRGVSQANHVATLVDLPRIARSLEFGAGSASLTRRLKEIRPQIEATVVELSQPMRDVLATSPLIHATMAQYTGELARFDLVMSSHALEHVHDVRATLADLVSWVHPDGWLMIEVPHANQAHYEGDHEFVPHSYFFTKDSLRRLVEAQGMDLVFISGGGSTWAEAGRDARDQSNPEEWIASGDTGACLRGVWRRPPESS